MTNERDCPHGRQIGKCADCDVERLEAENEALREANDSLATASILPDDKVIVSRADYAELEETLRETLPVLHDGFHEALEAKVMRVLQKWEATNGS